MPFLTKLVFATPPRGKPEQAGEIWRVLNGASKFHGKSLKSCLLTILDLLQDLLNASFASGSISMQFQQILKECSFRSVCLFQIKHFCVFCGGRTLHRMWRHSSTRGTFLERETRRRALTLRFNKQLETMKAPVVLPQKPSNRSSTWTTTSILLSVLKLL